MRRLLYFILGTTLFISCNKHTSDNNRSGFSGFGPGVYITGSNGTNPVLWKNDSMIVLSSSIGSGSQVIVSGNDVYVAGKDGESGLTTPAGPSGEYVYWKNGKPVNIAGPEFLNNRVGISVAGNDVYYINGDLWENGIKQAQPGNSGFYTGISTVGTDVYIAGMDSVGDAVYWKNGVLQVVAHSSAGTSPSAVCLYVSGSDVYVGGITTDDKGVYWKNGIANILVAANSSDAVFGVNSIFVSGNDVYAAANLFVPTNGGNNVPAYWKNGIEYDLPLNGATYGSATAIFVSGTDVYVAGYTSAGAVFWKSYAETLLAAA